MAMIAKNTQFSDSDNSNLTGISVNCLVILTCAQSLKQWMVHYTESVQPSLSCGPRHFLEWAETNSGLHCSRDQIFHWMHVHYKQKSGQMFSRSKDFLCQNNVYCCIYFSPFLLISHPLHRNMWARGKPTSRWSVNVNSQPILFLQTPLRSILSSN